MNDFLKNLMAQATANADKDEPHRCVVRLTTGAYMSSGEINFKKTLRVLKRKSHLNLQDMGIEDPFDTEIENLNQVEDGIYELVPAQYDWDGDDYTSWQYPVTWKLVPFNG